MSLLQNGKSKMSRTITIPRPRHVAVAAISAHSNGVNLPVNFDKHANPNSEMITFKVVLAHEFSATITGTGGLTVTLTFIDGLVVTDTISPAEITAGGN